MTYLKCGPPECAELHRYGSSSASDIELNAYLLLIYATMDDVGRGLPVLKFLTSNQNNLGGYHSTQV